MGLVGVGGDRRGAGGGSSTSAAVMAACGGALAREDDGVAMEGFSKAGAEWGRSAAQHRGACTRLAASSSMPAAAWLGNERGNSRNALERGEHELQRVEESRF